MATWLVTVQIPVEAPNRREAWASAREEMERREGTVLSIPQAPEEEEVKG